MNGGKLCFPTVFFIHFKKYTAVLIDPIKQFFFLNTALSAKNNDFQLSALRILLVLTLGIFALSEIHSVMTSADWTLISINSAYIGLLGGLLYFSHTHTKISAALFLSSILIANILLLMLSDAFYAEIYALVSLYSIPLMTRVLFSFRASLFAIVLNFCPFYLIASQSLADGQNQVTSAFYFQLLTFVTLNIGLPFAVSRIIQNLENNASHMSLLYRKLNDNYAMYEEFFEHTGTPTLLCDKRGKLLKANQLARQLLSDNQQAIFPGSLLTDWLSPVKTGNKKPLNKLVWKNNLAECTLKNSNNRNVNHQNESEIHIEIKKAPLTQYGHVVLHLQNTTPLRAMQQELEDSQHTNSRLAHFDLLTQLPNHKHFCQQVNQRIHDKEQHLTGAMFIIRISQFKLLNKQYGRDSANKIILDFSNTLQEKLSDQATVGRLRGVKFSCFVPLGQAYLLPRHLSTLIHSVLPSQISVKGSSLNMDYQVGIAYYDTDGKTAEELLEHCELALEYSNTAGRFSYYNQSLESKLLEEHVLGLALNKAIKNKDIQVWLQPQVTGDGQIRSFEALARWEHNGQFVPPNVFIEIAEKLGLLPLLAENLVYELMGTLTQWHEEHVHTSIAFNLAGQELMNDGFFALLMSLISDNPWLGDMLELEITETSPVMTHPLIHKRLRSLSQYGYTIAIDDFGTGQASLGQLIDIPANVLKIDRRFVAPLPQDQRHVDIVKSTIKLAESLNMKVIAEGIETKEQATLLLSLGCEILQGYYYGKPSPLSEWTDQNHAKVKALRMVY